VRFWLFRVLKYELISVLVVTGFLTKYASHQRLQ
jgi:hypothetical protein